MLLILHIYAYVSYLFMPILCILLGAPSDLLKSIIPNEATHLDKAAGVHARFRLGYNYNTSINSYYYYNYT